MESTTTAVQTALTTGFTNMASGMGTAVANAVPLALGVIGLVLIVSFGIKTFKRITGR